MGAYKQGMQELGGQRGEGVYFRENTVYLFVRDLAQQRPNAHAQSPRVRM